MSGGIGHVETPKLSVKGLEKAVMSRNGHPENNCLPDTSHTKYSLAGAVVNYILWMKGWINGLQVVDKIASAIILRRFLWELQSTSKEIKIWTCSNWYLGRILTA
ncbi:hypothetical protein A6M27_13480 [Acidithiobacillus thiooxidans]|uniref:Uncharacterized protein n=1 Tax=Acidithiobacillus thiooxidans TaxID=930 RepID=A0A1C2I7Q9_ACITH|nr:hypothetical protein A6P07_10825 [Acidithiobacillus thiooxidans]OCX72803.1 hypothetical protein A6O24_13200 [Acidithiobacillus thiooxidans]OCX74864.1 hypothetical protein A6M23_04615 [Acidithiobacillus thiooxidans]OCX79043.1 hypothetical protein A6P08_18535 [Acidithiobacillus thiooxidans]OCX85073.1 hypothetical protein A6O26_02550 [Acidithiobacillus thiooxidans]